MRLVVIGQVGSDAGYWVFDGKGWHHVGGWAPEAMVEVTQALKVIATARQLKTPGLADTASKGLMDFVQKELSAHVKEGDVVVIQ
jgi:hypothetical protein